MFNNMAPAMTFKDITWPTDKVRSDGPEAPPPPGKLPEGWAVQIRVNGQLRDVCKRRCQAFREQGTEWPVQTLARLPHCQEELPGVHERQTPRLRLHTSP